MTTGAGGPDDEHRPRPGDRAPADPGTAAHAPDAPSPTAPARPSRHRRLPGRALAVPEPPPPGQLVSSTAGAIVSVARVGRLLGRTGLRLARQLPVVSAVEAQAQRLGQAAAGELVKMLDIPQQFVGGSATPDERRVMMLLDQSGSDPEPLRSAMGELLQRSSVSDSEQGREYLFGTIISQLVPDEARILAILAGGRRFAAVDVLAKQVGRSSTRVILANASVIGGPARVALPENVPTYLARLHGLGLLEFSPSTESLESQFAALGDDPQVRAAKAEADGKFGSAKLVRKSVVLSSLGREFWTACAPPRREIDRLSG